MEEYRFVRILDSDGSVAPLERRAKVQTCDYLKMIDEVDARTILKKIKDSSVGKIDGSFYSSADEIDLGNHFMLRARLSYVISSLRECVPEFASSKFGTFTEREWNYIIRNGVDTVLEIGVWYKSHWIIHCQDMSIKQVAEYIANM